MISKCLLLLSWRKLSEPLQCPIYHSVLVKLVIALPLEALASLVQRKIISLMDFQKAFNSVSFDFINTVLKLFGFGPYFTCCINIRLGNTSRGGFNGVNVVNGHISVHFHLQRGCRQCDTCLSCVLKSCSYSLIKNSKLQPYLTSGLNPILNDTYTDDLSAYLKY